MNKYVLFAVGLLIALFFMSCSSQKVEPTAPIYNITINQTDNSQNVIGDNNKSEAKPVVQNKAVAEIKPTVSAEAEQTTKNGMWIYWLVVTLGLVVALWFVWKKWGKML
ncbi:MAG: hypothetical protein PHE89_02590 [Alphaproteobacteria bacterium]|nr:hypothetical protein [Alphaproteobacteria bacterium]